MAQEHLLTGAELVLVAKVPRAGYRWKQVHFNAELVDKFFRVGTGAHQMVFERVDAIGQYRGSFERQLVYSDVNRNPKIEFDMGDVKSYPEDGVPVLVILELNSERHEYRYQLVMPGDDGHEEMLTLIDALPSVGRGLDRVITNLDEVELRWPGCRLRSPRPGPL